VENGYYSKHPAADGMLWNNNIKSGKKRRNYV
jgi:hypothetical protein